MSQPTRSLWPFAIITFFVVAFIGLGTFVGFALRHREELVRPDYYEAEVRYQQQLNNLNRTAAVQQPATVKLDSKTENLVITLPPQHAGLKPTGTVQLYRPSDSSLDQQLPLVVDAQGVQRIGASELHAGLWKIRLRWNVGGEEFYLDQPLVVGNRPQ